MKRTRIYCGMNKPNGSHISPQDFDSFLKTKVAPRFIEGFTVSENRGYWQDATTGSPVFEDSKVIEHLHDGSRAEVARLIAEEFKEEFDQDSVLISTDEHVDLQFI